MIQDPDRQKRMEKQTVAFHRVTRALEILQEYKGQLYGDAWCKHGEVISIFGNTSRKYDRIENMVYDKINHNKPFPDPVSDESMAETVGDLAVYSILWLTKIAELRPEEFESWLNKILAKKVEPSNV